MNLFKNSSFKGIISVIMSFVILFVSFYGNASAMGTNDDQFDNISIIEENQTRLVTLFEKDGTSIYTTYEKNSKELTAEVIERPNNILGFSLFEPTGTQYEIEVDTAFNGEFKGTLKNTDTEEEIIIDTTSVENDQAVAQIVVPLIPVLQWLGAAVVATLGIAAIFYIDGELAVSISEAKVQTDVKRDPNAYYLAAVNFDNNQVFIGPKYNYNGALSKLRAGFSIYTVESKRAETLAKNLSTHEPILHTREYYTKGEGYLMHWHPANKLSNGKFEKMPQHVWFGF